MDGILGTAGTIVVPELGHTIRGMAAVSGALNMEVAGRDAAGTAA